MCPTQGIDAPVTVVIMNNTDIEIGDDFAFDAPATRRFIPSAHQVAIFDWIRNGHGDAIVNAVAGSGKTTTLVQVSRLLPPSTSAMFCAFNAHIVTTLKQKLDGMECATIHSLGLRTLAAHFGKQPKVESGKYPALIRKEAFRLADEMPTVKRTELYRALSDLVDLCQATLTLDFSPGAITSLRALESLVRHFGLVCPCPLGQIISSVVSVLREGLRIAHDDRVISFSDMLWLPWVWALQPRTYDWLFVDECQDLNAAQLDLVLKMRSSRGRMIFVGDPRQAIYGFSGADAQSYANIKERTGATEFPLSVSYRCPVLVVREAQAIIPEIQARPGAPLGTVRWISETALYSEVKEGDLLLCRMTAPLVSTCLDLIRLKVPARVRGKDIGKMLTKTVQLVAERSGFTFAKFPKFLHDHTEAVIKKLTGRDDAQSQIERAWDIEDALRACFDAVGEIQIEGAALVKQIAGQYFNPLASLQNFQDSIAALFSDDRPGVWLSTVHKAKGLESERVYILRPDRLPMVWKGQQAWEYEQELNLSYVAKTRAMEELVYVRQVGEAI